MHVEIRLQNCSLTAERMDYLKEDLGLIPQLVKNFPVAELHVDIHKQAHQHDFEIKMSLRLPKDTLIVGDQHHDLMPAYHQCIHKMVGKIKDYKSKLSNKHRWQEEVPVAEEEE